MKPKLKINSSLNQAYRSLGLDRKSDVYLSRVLWEFAGFYRQMLKQEYPSMAAHLSCQDLVVCALAAFLHAGQVKRAIDETGRVIFTPTEAISLESMPEDARQEAVELVPLSGPRLVH